MKVLIIHNRYSSRVPSGENISVANEVAWLREAGVDVRLHQVSNDEVFGAGLRDKVGQALWSVWSQPALRHLDDELGAFDGFEPDVVHVHNLFPLLTASVPWAATRRGIPVLWTVRNTRVVCVNGTYFRDNAPCHQCRPGWRVPGIRYGCYGDSPLPAALVTGATSLFGSLARRKLTALAISDSMRRWLVDTARFDPARVRVKYNGVSAPPLGLDVPEPSRNRAFVFAGQLIPYKGLELLLEAWNLASPDLPEGTELRIVGSGRQADLVAAASARDRRIVAVGHVPTDEVLVHIAAARAVVVPSTWDEPFGRVAAEALAQGRPVITSGMGGLGEIVDDSTGWVVGTDPDVLAKALVDAATSDAGVDERGAAARRRHARHFSPEATTRALIAHYEEAVERDRE